MLLLICEDACLKILDEELPSVVLDTSFTDNYIKDLSEKIAKEFEKRLDAGLF